MITAPLLPLLTLLIQQQHQQRLSSVNILDSSTESQITSSDNSSITFNGSPATTQTLKPGDIIIVQNTARKVDSITTINGQTVINTVEPEFSEVVKSIEISGDVMLEEEHLDKTSIPNKVGVTVAKVKPSKDKTISASGNTFTYTFIDKVIDADGDSSTTFDQITINGEAVLEAPRLTFAFNYGIVSDKYAEINFKTGEQINLSFSSKELTFDKSVTLPLGKLIIPIAVTGGTVNVTISLNLVFGANGSAKFETGFTQKLSIDAGMKATLNPANVTSFNNSNYDFTFQQPQLEGKISVSAAVNPDVDLKLWQYTLAGINNNLGVKTTAKANISLTNICYRVSADAYLSSIAFVMLPKASLNISFSWDGLSGGLDFSMEKYPKELFTYTKPLYDSGETCIVENIAPVANAGSDKTSNADTLVFLDGTDSIDTDGTITSYEWTQTAGTKVTLTNSSSATPSFTTPSTADTLSFKLTVTDNKGATATDYVNVTVSGEKSNYKPTANAGSDRSVNSSVIVTLDGSASSDTDGSIVSYKWKQTGGTQVSLTNDDTSTPSFTAPSTTDTVTFKMTVTDSMGATASDYVQVSVTSAITGSAPSAPTGVTATAGNGQVNISWTSVSDATSYNIYWSTSTGVTKTSGTKLTGGTSPYTHTGRTNGTTYYYVVTAVNSYGESSESSQVSGIPSTTTTSDTTAPSSPSVSINSGATSSTSTSVTLTLSATDNVGVTAYYASETSTTPSASATGWTSVTSTTSYSASVSFALSSGSATKTVYVWFKDAAGNISASSSDSITLGSAPSAPTGVSATAGSSQVSISWSSVSGATSYNIYWSTTSGVTKTTGTKITGGTSPYAHTGLTNGTTYYYVVTAVNSYGESSESSQVSATPSTTSSTWTMLKLPDTGQTTSYTTTYGEDHDYSINPPSYTDNGNGTITDNVTGLIWQKEDDNTQRTWSDAGTYCDNLTLGGQSDWRLPSKKELISIVNYGTYSPSINTTYFPNTNSSVYWSSTTIAYNSSGAWIVLFNDGYVVIDYKSSSYYVRCVR